MSADLKVMVTDYLRVRRAPGYTLKGTELLLVQFVDYLRAHNAEAVTVEHALGFAQDKATGTGHNDPAPVSWATP